MKILTADSPGIEINATCEWEDVPVRGNALASGDDAEDREAEQVILGRLERGEVWAWCTVAVKVSYKEILSAVEYLGCCSYDSEDDFRTGGYFDDMVATCLGEINRQRAEIAPCDIRKTVRIAPLSMSELVYGNGDEDRAMEDARLARQEERWTKGV